MSFLAVNLYFFGFGNMVENFSNSKEKMLVTARKKWQIGLNAIYLLGMQEHISVQRHKHITCKCKQTLYDKIP